MIELLERQKKLTTNQWKLICTANLADLLDFFDFFLIGYVTAALTKQWSLTYWEGGAILLASGLGAVEAGLIGGASDASTSSGMGIASIDGLGPRGKGFHTVEEQIEVETLVPKAEALARFLAGRARAAGG